MLNFFLVEKVLYMPPPIILMVLIQLVDKDNGERVSTEACAFLFSPDLLYARATIGPLLPP